MPNRSKQKGDRVERQMVKLLQGIGLEAERLCLPAQAGKHVNGDLEVGFGQAVSAATGLPIVLAEVKARANAHGWKTLAGWLAKKDILLLKQDRELPIVAVRWWLFERLVSELIRRVSRDRDPVPARSTEQAADEEE